MPGEPLLRNHRGNHIVKYELLGPLRVTEGHRHASISAQKVTVVLAALLIRADQVVGLDQLIGEIWGQHPPRRATAGLHVYISQLRKFLRRHGAAERAIVTRPPGYLLRLGADETDHRRFLALVERGKTHAAERRHDRAIARFEEAAGLWRGPALGDLRGGPIIEGFTTWLAETRLECLEMLSEAKLATGRHRELIGPLFSLAAEHPLREPIYRQLMLALYRSDRQADALRVYQTVRRTLDEELGLQPCRALQDLHQAVLAADVRLDRYAPADVRLDRYAAEPVRAATE
ncbi:BTAD domain-containing putative transcriptional regulator [Actinomadura sp. GTD37]|uniref:AfsR/SARP family transcriptional regulator n=1 Tax=Actinomadura sp. GTD37 TaxID=1778030 RepID=UPI0035C198CB